MKKIGDLFTQSSGKALKKSNQIGTLHKYITTSNLFWGRFDFSEVREMFFQDSELEKCTARNGDLLVCNGGDVGRAAVWNYDYDICLQNHITRLRKKSDNVNPCYYQHFFRYIKTNNLINGNGVGIESLSSKEILNMSVPYPSIEEQNRIVGIFDRIQSAIDNKKQQLSLLDEAVKSEFVELFGDIQQYEKLSAFSTLITKGASPRWQGFEYTDEGTLFITSENVRERFIDYSKKKFLPDNINDILPRSILKKNDVLINIVGASIGRAAIFDSDLLANINQAVALVRLDSNKIDELFLVTYLNSEKALKMYSEMKKGGARDNLSLQNISDLKIPICDLKSQKKFAAFVQQIDKSKFVVKQQIADLQELLDSKMQKYFGE